MPGNGGQPFLQVRGQAAQGVQVVAVDLQRNLRAHAGQQVVEPVRNRLADAGETAGRRPGGCGCRR